jgi:hypothetical protein
MALTLEPTWGVTVRFQDRDRNLSSTGFYLPSALAFEDAQTAALAIATAMAALSDGIIVSVGLSASLYDAVAATALAPETADVERKGVFQFVGANRGIRTKVEIPSIKNSLVVDGSNVLLVSDPAVTGFIATFLDTGLGAGNSPVSAAGSDFTASDGTPHKIHRGSGKG